mmetsp:Transcript_77803/g.172350  ORF Transcript_77803/g.172350 Transcript_77803/m.172350 type:complete len:308 (+) Transcript_77803:171-1094(+)
MISASICFARLFLQFSSSRRKASSGCVKSGSLQGSCMCFWMLPQNRSNSPTAGRPGPVARISASSAASRRLPPGPTRPPGLRLPPDLSSLMLSSPGRPPSKRGLRQSSAAALAEAVDTKVVLVLSLCALAMDPPADRFANFSSGGKGGLGRPAPGWLGKRSVGCAANGGGLEGWVAVRAGAETFVKLPNEEALGEELPLLARLPRLAAPGDSSGLVSPSLLDLRVLLGRGPVPASKLGRRLLEGALSALGLRSRAEAGRLSWMAGVALAASALGRGSMQTQPYVTPMARSRRARRRGRAGVCPHTPP